jgi:hypothetical protein
LIYWLKKSQRISKTRRCSVLIIKMDGMTLVLSSIIKNLSEKASERLKE